MAVEHVQNLPPAIHSLPTRWLTQLMDRLERGRLDVRFGETHYCAQGTLPGPQAELRITNPLRMLRKVATGGDVGFAEAYMAGDWDSPELAVLLEVLAGNLPAIRRVRDGSAIAHAWNRVRHWLNRNSRSGSRRNIAYHYDLGNEFYARWLDPSMTYSSGLFNTPGESLAQAQRNKYTRLLDWLEAKSQDHILEIGCGWGGFAREARQRGHRVTGISLSREQLAWATQALAASGTSERVCLRYQDYRDVKEQFDHIVSIEMFEAVGETYWPNYMETLKRCLKPGGRAAVQVITIEDSAFERYRRRADFIQRYIFPGGMLPTPSRFVRLAEQAGLRVMHQSMHGEDYAQTIAAWHRRFMQAQSALRDMGFEERFLRMWRYYLAYCEAGFRTGRINLMQICLTH